MAARRRASVGTVVLSIDAGLGWKFHDLETPPAERVEAGREGWTTLVELLDEYEIPATWAVVGHLFLDSCDGIHSLHPTPEGWFERERTEWAQRPDLRYGPDLIDRISAAEAEHEIGCHTFSHVEFGDPSTTTEIAREELVASLEAAATRSPTPSMSSVVFPRNNVGHRDVLAEWGFTCYRGVSPADGTIHKVTRATIGQPPLVRPQLDEYGLVNIPASMFLYGFEGRSRRAFERVWDDPIVRAVRRGVDAVAGTDRIFHIWLHPNNLVTEAETVRLRRVLAAVARKRDAGEIRVETMRDVSQRKEPDFETASAAQHRDG